VFKKIKKFWVGIPTFLSFFAYQIRAFAEDNDPLSQINIVKSATKVDATQIYKDLNSIVSLIFYGAGFFSLIALIFAAVLLSTAGNNPTKRSGGFAALSMACLGGWVLYKATSIAQWLGHFGG
jgi:hypothetical protein